MARMYSNVEILRRDFGDSLQPTNCILDSCAKCHMTPEILDFIPVSLVETYKYVEVADGHLATEKKTGQVQIKICDYNGEPFIATLYNVLFAPDLCNKLFSIIK